MLFFRSSVRSLSNSNLLIGPINSVVDSLLNKNKGRILIAAGVVVNKNWEASKVQCQYQQLRNFSSLNTKNFTSMSSLQTRRNLCTHEITKNLTLFSNQPRNVERDPKTLRLKEPIEAPLVLIFGWLLAKKKPLTNYVKLYTDHGFDALVVGVTPWQCLWPAKGSQIVAGSVVKFLENNPSYDPIVIHGFSVGGYMFGEVMVHMARDPKRYQSLTDRFVAQIWDSAADLTELSLGIPKAVFPKNLHLQKVVKNYIEYHLKTFHQQATVHYIRSSQMFHFTLVKAPALFFVSKDDPIGSEKSNLAVKENLEGAGVKVTWKCWDHSSHVLHFRRHPEEYKEYLFRHIRENAMEKIAQKCRVQL